MSEFLSEIPVLIHKSSRTSHTAEAFRPVSVDTEPEKKKLEGDIESLPSAPATSDSVDFPDGGFRAWAVAFGAFCTYFTTFGYISSWGIFQVYYQQVVLPHSSPSDISWIGSIQRCLIFLPGVFVGRIFDIGHFRIPFATGSILIITGTFLIPECKLYWHFILCQGFMIGLGCGLTYSNAGTIITHWWKRRRGLAFGVASSGSAIGGIFFPIVMRQLLHDLGFTWTCRLMGFIHIVTLSFANLCLTRRLPLRKADGGLFGFHVFRNPPFAVYCLSCLITPLGAFTVATYITPSAVLAGLSQTFAFYLVAVQNGGSGLGALIFGFYGDRLGAMNVLIQTITGIGIITVVWPFCRTVASLSVVALIYGLTAGAFSALGAVPVAAMGGTADIGRRLGTVNTVLGLGSLCGPPLGGLLTGTSLGYKAVGYFAGGMVFIGAFLFALARFLAMPKLWSKF
ncbi:MFS general substrate transporter [Mycena rosella]|uniref:MFS general substrate transporter n=1 Tax=Mycena rosella TaxID=1033263 RepID=A0AAD7G3L3_MYCRO|nr:MFS general substrate transporter [Mycena rosella]